MISLIITSVLFLVGVSYFAGDVARWIDYPNHPEYVRWFAWILALDAISAIPLPVSCTKQTGPFCLGQDDEYLYKHRA